MRARHLREGDSERRERTYIGLTLTSLKSSTFVDLSLVINLGVLWGSGASSDREGREVSAFVTLSERLSNPTFSERPIRCSSWLMEDE